MYGSPDGDEWVASIRIFFRMQLSKRYANGLYALVRWYERETAMVLGSPRFTCLRCALEGDQYGVIEASRNLRLVVLQPHPDPDLGCEDFVHNHFFLNPQ